MMPEINPDKLVSWPSLTDIQNNNNGGSEEEEFDGSRKPLVLPFFHPPPPPPSSSPSRGPELMRRLCALNPQFASSVVEDYIRPQVRDGDIVLEIECGSNSASLYLSRLCQGSKGPCIRFKGNWLTPNEFQFISGRETAKDWKRSIRHCGKSMKLLLTKGILTTHPPICDCEGCRISSPVNRGRFVEGKRHPDEAHSGDKSDEEDSVPPTSWHVPTLNQKLLNHLRVVERSSSMKGKAEDDEDDGKSSGGSSCGRSAGSSNIEVLASDDEIRGVRNSEEDEFQDDKERSDDKKEMSSIMASPLGGRSSGEGSPEPTGRQDNRRFPASPPKGGQMNYSEFMRNLAAKYNGTEPLPETKPVFDPTLLASRLKPPLLNGGNNPFSLQGPPNNAFPFPGFNFSGKKSDVPSAFPILAGLAAAAARAPNPFNNPSQPLPPHPSLDNPLLNLMRQRVATKRPLDLSGGISPCVLPPVKVSRRRRSSERSSPSLCSSNPCSNEAKIVQRWTVDEVAEFVESVELCRPFVTTFREQSIDGSSLLLLTEDHLMTNMKMKLGPVLKFKAALASKVGSCPVCLHCTHCHAFSSNNNESTDKGRQSTNGNAPQTSSSRVEEEEASHTE